MNTTKIIKATHFASLAHGAQRRKARKKIYVPYISHPIEVAKIVSETYPEKGDPRILERCLVVAMLHDTIEDTDTTYEDIKMLFGLDVARDVRALSVPAELKDPTEKLRFQKNSVFRDYTVALVKTADKTANFRDIVRCPPNWKPESFRGYLDSGKQVVQRALQAPLRVDGEQRDRELPQALIAEFWEAYLEAKAWVDEQYPEEG